MKKYYFVLLTAALLLLCAACAPQSTPTPEPAAAAVDINVAVLKGPTGIGAAYLLEQAETGQNNYTFTLVETPEQAVALLTNGSVDLAALPTNLAANLYAKTEGQIQMAAITAYGMLYLLEAGDSIQSWEDLRGQTIYATGRGANPEYILDYLLRAHDLLPGQDVTVEFKSEHAELATLLASGEVNLGMLPEPFVTSATMQNSDLRVVFDFNKEWVAGGVEGQMAMTCMAVRREFVAAHPAAVAEFLTDLYQSINYALEHTAQAAALCEKHGVIPKAAVAERAIPRCNLTFICGEAMQDTIGGYYQVLFNANPQSVGGALPDEAFYYIP